MKYDFGKKEEPFNRFCKCKEDWKEIKNKKGRKYELSSKGRLWSYLFKRFIGTISNTGYINSGGFNETRTNRLVYYHFKDKNIKDFEIDHGDTIRDNNCIKCNLIKCNRIENMNNKLTIKKMKKPKTDEYKKKYMIGKKRNFKGGSIRKTKQNTFILTIPINKKYKSKTFKNKDDLFIGKIYYNQLKLNVENNMILI